MSKNKYKVKKKRGIFAIATIATIVVIAVCCAFAWYQMYNLEQGILDVCATQQDAYVQLVVDQINLKENRDDEEIISEILSTLDSSSNKYWTFSKDRSMLFVKDVIETNRYKGLTVVTYYDSESAKDFLNSLRLDQVIHQNIKINEKEYVASGVAFTYSGDEYRLCLLTNKDVILNNNRFMVAKFEMIILIGFVLITLLCGTMIMAGKLEKNTNTLLEKEAQISELNSTVVQLNDIISQKDHYNTKYQIWSEDVIYEFMHKLIAKKVKMAYLLYIKCDDELVKYDFLERACIIVDKNILRFEVGESDVLLLSVKEKTFEIRKMIEPLLNNETKLADTTDLELTAEVADAYMRTLGIETKMEKTL